MEEIALVVAGYVSGIGSMILRARLRRPKFTPEDRNAGLRRYQDMKNG